MMRRALNDRGTRFRFICLAAIALLALALAGCAATDGQAEVNPLMDNGGDPNVQTCAYCTGKALPDSEARAEVVDGKQVARISIESGSYVPNHIVASAGSPITLEFEPSQPATGCIAMPTLKALDKKGKAKTEIGMVELGVLQPGEYEITCGMGSEAGLLTVE